MPAVKFSICKPSPKENQFQLKFCTGPFQVKLKIPRAKKKLIPAVRMANQSPCLGNFRPKKNRTKKEKKGMANKPNANCPGRLSEICDILVAAFRVEFVVR